MLCSQMMRYAHRSAIAIAALHAGGGALGLGGHKSGFPR